MNIRITLTAWVLLLGFATLNLVALPRHPWMDEAMLLVNFRGLSGRSLIETLPYYDQAMPLANALAAGVLRSLVGYENLYLAMRLLSLFSLFCTGLLVVFALHTKDRLYFGFVYSCLLLSCILLMGQAVTVKHYVWDAFFAAIILFAGMRAHGSGRPRDLWLFAVMAALCTGLSFVGILVATGFAVTMVVYRLRDGRGLLRTEKAGLAGAVVLPILVFVAVKLVYIDPVTEFQFSAYPVAYGEHIGGTGGLEDSFKRLLLLIQFSFSNIVFDRLVHPDGAWALRLSLVVLPVGLVVWSIRRGCEGAFLGHVAAVIFGLVLILNAAGLFPVPYSRHLSFLQPITLALAALLIVGVVRHSRAEPVVNLLLLAMAFDGVVLGQLPFDYAGKAQAFLASEDNPAPDAPIWVSFPAQPAFDYAEWPEARLLGLFDPASGPISWTVRGGGRIIEGEVDRVDPGYPDRMIRAIAPHDRVWLVLTEHWKLDEKIFLGRATEAGWACRVPTEIGQNEVAGLGVFLCDRAAQAGGWPSLLQRSPFLTQMTLNAILATALDTGHSWMH